MTVLYCWHDTIFIRVKEGIDPEFQLLESFACPTAPELGSVEGVRHLRAT
jgi:hypothetical protein